MELDNIKDELSGDWLFRDQIMIQGDSVMSLNLNSFLHQKLKKEKEKKPCHFDEQIFCVFNWIMFDTLNWLVYQHIFILVVKLRHIQI